jgi:hypothetical protein
MTRRRYLCAHVAGALLFVAGASAPATADTPLNGQPTAHDRGHVAGDDVTVARPGLLVPPAARNPEPETMMELEAILSELDLLVAGGAPSRSTAGTDLLARPASPDPWQLTTPDREPATTMEPEAIEAELDLLVAEMNESEGPSKIDAMADLMAKLVEHHRACESMMHSAHEPGSQGCCNNQE